MSVYGLEYLYATWITSLDLDIFNFAGELYTGITLPEHQSFRKPAGFSWPNRMIFLLELALVSDSGAS